MKSVVGLVGTIVAAELLLSCGAAAQVEPISPEAEKVIVRKSDPPPTATELDPIEVEHGSGCGAYGRQGTYEGALNLLKAEAANRGADYVSLLSMTEPHSEHGCFDQRFVLRGAAYKLATGEQQPDREEEAPASEACDPPCSPGYRCDGSTCAPLCNPPCAGSEVCRMDRTCGPEVAE
jgi:hypothetical protein